MSINDRFSSKSKRVKNLQMHHLSELVFGSYVRNPVSSWHPALRVVRVVLIGLVVFLVFRVFKR